MSPYNKEDCRVSHYLIWLKQTISTVISIDIRTLKRLAILVIHEEFCLFVLC